MRTHLFITALICLAAAPIQASRSCYVIAFSGEQSTAVSLEKDADFVSMPLKIASRQRDPNKRFIEIKRIQDLIIANAKKQAGIEIHKGPISLSAASRSKSYSYPQSSTAQMYVLAKLDEKTDIFSCASRIRNFLDSIKRLNDDEYSLGQIQLAVKNPEQYRSEILKKIAEDVNFVKSTTKFDGKISFSGLERPVIVRQVNDRKVELFINYSMTIELPGK